MHDTALANGKLFFETYAPESCTIVEVGAMDVNGSLRSVAPSQSTYIGIDLESGPGVDIVVAPGSDIPLQDDSVDVAVASSAFEHDRQFWRTFNNMCRVTRPGGYVYINAPSNGSVHAYPLDCWRFYPDAGIALEQLMIGERWSARLVESYTAERHSDGWNDFVAVFRRDGGGETPRPTRMYESVHCRNIYDAATGQRLQVDSRTEDMQLLAECTENLSALKAQLAQELADRDRRIGQLEPALTAAQAAAEQQTRQIAHRDQQIEELAASNASLQRKLTSLSDEIDTFNASWMGRAYGILWRQRRRSGFS